MKRAPSTFALILGLVALALLFALGLASSQSLRFGLRAIGDNYGRLLVAATTAADDLSMRDDAASKRVLAALERAGISFSRETPPPPTVIVAPMIRSIGEAAGRLLDDPSRVVVTQVPESEIWIRSAHDPQRWIVLHATSYRSEVLRSSFRITVFAGLLALIVAGLAARLLTRPLERLAEHAPELLAGATMEAQLRGSPREVLHLAAAIGRAGERQRETARERELMLAGISHDLRTPLARLRLALELGDASDPQRRGAMLADLEELDAALAQCLAFVRDGRDETPRDTDLVTLAGQLLALRRDPDDWVCRMPAELSACVRAGIVRRALGNLMDNAERYGKPPFHLILARDGECIRLCVEDHGPGVRDDLLPRLGKPFVRGDTARGGGGSGLGLSIAQRAAELHGGVLRFGDRAGGGFRAELELHAIDPIQSKES